MEIRNCIFRGTLNAAIKGFSENQDFKDCINIRNFGKRMEDRSLVLRFLAFHQRNYRNANQGLKDFLNSFFADNRNASPEAIKQHERTFNHCMRCAKTVFGSAGFRLRKKIGRDLTGEWASRPNASVFQVVATSFADKDAGLATKLSDAILEEYLDLLEDARWVEVVSRSTGDQAHIRYAFETWNRRLDSLLASYENVKRDRTFTRALKKELFEQHCSCAACGNEIRLMNDAEIDHIEQYWRGGSTIPENARLVHRSCNRRRSKSE